MEKISIVANCYIFCNNLGQGDRLIYFGKYWPSFLAKLTNAFHAAGFPWVSFSNLALCSLGSFGCHGNQNSRKCCSFCDTLLRKPSPSFYQNQIAYSPKRTNIVKKMLANSKFYKKYCYNRFNDAFIVIKVTDCQKTIKTKWNTLICLRRGLNIQLKHVWHEQGCNKCQISHRQASCGQGTSHRRHKDNWQWFNSVWCRQDSIFRSFEVREQTRTRDVSKSLEEIQMDLNSFRISFHIHFTYMKA